MLVQRVAMPNSGVESWTVLGDDDIPIEPIERYLAYLTDIERSPNTVKAYAHNLKDYWVYLAHRRLDWREVRLEDIGEFVAWLRLPPVGRAGVVVVLPSVQPHVSALTINRNCRRWLRSTLIRPVMGWIWASCCSPGSPGRWGQAVVGGSRFCTI
jgi:hypothetical protein